MGKGYRDNVDYSREIEKAKSTGASQATINQLQRERQNKINDRYDGNEPNMIGSDKTYSEMSSSGSSYDRRQIDNAIISQPGGTLWYDGGTKSVSNRGQSWDPNIDYSAQAEYYASIGDWDAADDALMRRGDKMQATGSTGGGKDNVRLWYELNQRYGGPSAGTSLEDMYAGAVQAYGPGGRDGTLGGGFGGAPGGRPVGGFGGGFGGGHGGGYGPGGYDLSDYLREQQAAQTERDLARLKAAYEKSMQGYNDAAERLPATYDAAKNHVAAQNAIMKKNFDERAAVSGLNSGTSGQAELARSSAYQAGIAGLDEEQANALSDIDLKKANLESEYQSAIVEARASGDAALANALYEELVRVQGMEREDAQIAANNAAREKELALRYAPKGETESIAGEAMATPTKQPGSSKKPTTKNYENGSLSVAEIKEMQKFYGVDPDGKWGKNSQKAAGDKGSGKSAEEAWAYYKKHGKTIGGKPIDEYDSAASNYAEVKNMADALLASEGKAAVLKMLQEAYQTGVLNVNDYMSLYNKYRG